LSVFYLMSSSICMQAFCRLTFSKSISSLRSSTVFLSMSLLILDKSKDTFVPFRHGPCPAAAAHTFHLVRR
jgi:hypothetical protein